MELLGIIVFLGIIYFVYQYINSSKPIQNPFESKNIVSPEFENKSGIPDEALNEAFDKLLDNFIQGKNADNFDTNLILRKNERLIFDIPNISLCEDRTVKVKGGYQGLSVRIMKGVSYRFGGFEAASEKKIIEIDSGNLILTNKRMVFSGKKSSKDILLNKINTIDTIENGFAITRTGKQKTEYYVGTNNLFANITLVPEDGESWEEGEVKWQMTGFEVKKMITILLQEG
ncbi:hypothetical protein ACFLZA_02955 [Candidatus Neomarinimicrobiota bacterium]